MEFLDLYHQLRYQTVMAIKKNSFKMGNYTYVETKDPNFDFVVIEDQGRVFVLKVNKDCLNFNSDIHKCLGFDYYYTENFEFRSGISIGVLDLVIKVIKTFNNEKEVKEYIMNEEIIQYEAKDYARLSNFLYFENPYEEFLNKIYDKDLEEVKTLSRNYLEIRNILDRSFDELPELDSLYRDIEARLIELARKYNVQLSYTDSKKLYDTEQISEDEEHVESEIKAPINVIDLLAKIRMKKVLERKEEFYDFLMSKKGKISLWNGEVKAYGILLDELNNKNATLLILDPQDIEITRNWVTKKIRVKPSLILIKKSEENFQVLV